MDYTRSRTTKKEVLNIYDGNIQRPIDTGFSNLDEFYKVMPSTFCVVTGIPNHGKSNFIDQLAVNLSRNIIGSSQYSPQNIRQLTTSDGLQKRW